MNSISRETMALIEEIHNTAGDMIDAAALSVKSTTDMYKRLLEEICKRDKRIKDLEDGIEREIAIITGGRD